MSTASHRLRRQRSRAVDRLVARIYATRARILRYAGSDPELLAIAATLQDEQPVYGVATDRVSMKRAHFASGSVLRSRGVDGLAVRRGK